MKLFNKKQILFVIIFVFIGFIAFQIPFTHIVGSKINFTLFDALAPTAGAFLGSISGVITVLLMEALNFAFHGFHIQDAGTLIKFLPALFATFYFAKKRNSNILIPIIAIIAFNLHPVGRTVWYFSLYWLIPIACHFLRDRWLLARSLGSTFTAHAVGSSLWIYFFNMPASVWIALIPVVALERTFFALGITLAYIIVSNVIFVLEKKWFSSLSQLQINKKYIWRQIAAKLN